MLVWRIGRFYLSLQTSCKAKRLVWDAISCIFTVGRQRCYEIREIYTSLTMKVSLQPVIVSYTNDDNSSCSCHGECAEAKTFGSPVAAAGGGVFALSSLYPDTNSYLRTQADVTDHLWQGQVNYVSCVMRSSVYGTKVPRAGINTDIAGTDHSEVKHLTASTSPVFQGPHYNLSSLTQQLLCANSPLKQWI